MSQSVAGRRGPGRRALAALLTTALAASGLVGCSSHSAPQQRGLAPADQVAPSAIEPASGVRLPPFTGRISPDLVVSGALTASDVRALRRLRAATVSYATGSLRVRGTLLQVAAVDPVSFRRFTPEGTAQSDALWKAVAAGQLVASHDVAKRLSLPLGGQVPVKGSGASRQLRVGGFATTGIPGTDLLVSTSLGKQLGVLSHRAVLLHASRGTDRSDLAAKARSTAGKGADVDLLAPPSGNPIAFLTGSSAAQAFGAFSYRYHSDGTIEPDSRWVRQNIVTAHVPLLGTVTCHRLMIPQLRAALQEVVDQGLGGTLHHYDGCYVPRFIERNPNQPVSLHTWGIAIDIDAARNGRGTKGHMDPRVVAIFKKWGFRWGGDWAWTDPMHFELGALLKQ